MPLRYLLAFFLLAALAGRAQAPQTVRPALTAATIYLDGMTLEHQANVALQPGLNRLVLQGLSTYVELTSMEVKPGEGGELLAIESAPAPPSLVMRDSLTRARTALTSLQAELNGLKQEKAFLLANQTLPAGTQANWSAEVQRGATLMRTRLPGIERETAQLQARLTDGEPQFAALEKRVNASGGTQYALLVRAARAATVPLTVRYRLLVPNAWLPRLNIRADEPGRQLRFELRGFVENSTDLPWQDVRVALLDYAQGESFTRPALEPLEIGTSETDLENEGRIDRYLVKGNSAGQQTASRSRYELPGPLTLAPHAGRDFVLAELALTGRPEYLAVPRVAQEAFLQSRVTGWRALHLPDTADVYRAGSFVGGTRLDTRAYNDSLEVTLGRAPEVLVSRAKLEDFSTTKVLAGRRQVRLAYELNVLNQHPTAIHLRLLDQIPVIAEKGVQVKLLSADKARLDKRSGQLTWLLTLPAGASQRLRFSFEVAYPRQKRPGFFRRRVRIVNPKFRN